MNDLISRQALLNKFEPWLKVKDYSDGELNMLKAILYEIRFMPSATDKNVGTKLSTNLAQVGTDCISRQQAIDLLKQMRKDGDMIPWEGKDVFARIRKLPSAQPEDRCSECDAWNQYKNYPRKPHWIPVTKKCECDLMDNEEVLVCQKDGQIRHAMFYDFNGKKKFVTWEEGITIYDVVAYMPLPEPYKEVTT